jgi:hypothetical protein
MGRKVKEESQVVAVNKGEWHKRAAMLMLASVAQQGVAPEPPPRGSRGCW